MRGFKEGAAIAAALSLAGCVTAESVRFEASPQQQAITRDGKAALVSRKKNSIVMISPATRTFGAGRRPVYVLAVDNIGKAPAEFRLADVTVNQVLGEGRTSPLAVKTYDQLVQEERNRQIAAAIIVGLAAGANAYAASQAGFGSAHSTVVSHGHISNVTTHFYSPTAAAIAQSSAAAQNDALVADAVEAGRQNLASLERNILKDDTVLPGEWYGGQLHFEAPVREEGKPETYSIDVRVGDDLHHIDVVQQPVKTGA